jgi:hypothetical protein
MCFRFHPLLPPTLKKLRRLKEAMADEGKNILWDIWDIGYIVTFFIKLYCVGFGCVYNVIFKCHI